MAVSTRGWSVVLGSFLVHFASLGVVYSAGIYFLPVAAHFDKGQCSVQSHCPKQLRS